ncbi:MAG: hypothetical protein ACI4VQ_04695 [Clostridia bacterium]
MSKLSEEYLKIIKDIEKNISNEEEKRYVLEKIAMLSSLYMDVVDRVADSNAKRIDKIEERVESLTNFVNLVKKDIYQDDEYDFEIVCPYCNYEFVADVEDELKEEIECPECHNIIELDWDGEGDGCDGHCCSCEHHYEDEDCQCDEEDDEEKNNEDDM